MVSMSSSPTATASDSAIPRAEELKSRGNSAFRKGDVRNAIACYTSALECLGDDRGAADGGGRMPSTLLSNRAMCRLKAAETRGAEVPAPDDDAAAGRRRSLRECIDDCTSALELLDGDAAAGGENDDDNVLRGKVLYRRAKARVLVAAVGEDDGDDDGARERDLNAAAKDLLRLLSFDAGNGEAASLLRAARAHHGRLGGGMGRSRVSKALDCLRRAVDRRGRTAADDKGGGSNDDELDPLQSLRVLQGSLADDAASSAEDVGRRGGAALLRRVARDGIPVAGEGTEERCRVAALRVLSACCSHDPFVPKHGGRDVLAPSALARIVEGESAKSDGSADVAVAATALLVRLVVHWDRGEAERFFAPEILGDGSIKEGTGSTAGGERRVPEADGPSVCRAATAALLWGSGGGPGGRDARAPRAALDLVSAWTASDLDALDAASDACLRPDGRGDRRASRHRLTPEDVRRMKPRQVAARRMREGEHRRHAVKRAVRHVSMFCGAETGGLDAMLSCAARTRDPRLRREVGLQVGRMTSVLEEDDDAKKLVAGALGCTDWRIGREEEKEGGGAGGRSTVTIEELDEEKEADDDDGEGGGADAELLASMKRGQLAASLLVGRPDVGTWALKYGWSDGDGVEELKGLISSDDPRAMSIASELVSAASSVESSRPLLLPLVQEGTLEDLLIHPDADVRSGAASCAAKIGLASKALSADEGEVMELLDVAIELLFEEDEWTEDGAGGDSGAGAPPSSNAAADSTSMDRGVEVLAYLASKTFVKERVANGYRPEGSPADRKTALQRLVEIACAPEGAGSQAAFGLAGVFDLLSASVETLREEAFVGKEITREQYDQLQALGKTEDEKEAEAKVDGGEGDGPRAVAGRIGKLANANVPRAMVRLLEGASSDASQEKLLEGMGRMASESSVRGLLIQQGCLTTCLRLDKGDKPNEAEKKILRRARSCVAKMLVTTNPGVLTVSQRSGSVGPLLALVKDHDALDLMHFEALMSLTNLAGFDDETRDAIVARRGVPVLSYAMFSDHEMVRRAATEAMCNMIPHREMMGYLGKPENLRVWIAFAMDHEENPACARAAAGGLAMAAPDPGFAGALVASGNFGEFVRALMECGQLELMHRALVLVVGLIEHGGGCREAVVATGAGPFCEAYIRSYQDEKRTMKDFKFGPGERGALTATLSLAKEVVTLLR